MKMSNLKWRFWLWCRQHRGLINWYKNKSVLWSKKEQNLQRSLQATHESFGEKLIKTTDDVDWGEETDSFEIENCSFRN